LVITFESEMLDGRSRAL